MAASKLFSLESCSHLQNSRRKSIITWAVVVEMTILSYAGRKLRFALDSTTSQRCSATGGLFVQLQPRRPLGLVPVGRSHLTRGFQPGSGLARLAGPAAVLPAPPI